MRLPSPYPLSITVAACALVVAGVAAQPQELPEYQIKARYVMTLADYVTWPAAVELRGGGRTLVLGILGTSPFEGAREETFFTREVKGKRLTVRNLKNLKDSDSCDIIFICESEAWHLQDILKQLRTKPILTIGDTPEFAKRGVMINLYQENARVRFEINLASVRASGLEVGSRVLKLAKMVE